MVNSIGTWELRALSPMLRRHSCIAPVTDESDRCPSIATTLGGVPNNTRSNNFSLLGLT